MQNKGIKSVFKLTDFGNCIGSFPFLPENHTATFQLVRSVITSLYKFGEMSSFRVVVGNTVIEAHVDKHKNLIYREYEKKK